jgi:transposase
MRKIREILRLKYTSQLSNREIAKSCSTARSTVAGCLERASHASLSWPLPDGLDDTALERLLYPTVVASDAVRAAPQWALLQKELRKKNVTLALLWDEYKAGQPDGYQYSQFCKLYKEFTGRVDCCMRQCHLAGEKLFVDYCGQTVPLTDPATGIVEEAQVFVAVMGASSYTYAEATLSQSLPDWLGSHVRAFRFLGGLPQIIVPDNLRSAVSKPCRYEPKLNPSYAELADHYNVAVMPARVRKPRDKAKAEAGVQLVQRWILAVLRNRTFFSLDELNEAIALLLTRLNAKPFRKISGSRESLFVELDKPALAPLPSNHYEYAEWLPVRLGFNYHVQIEDHFYSAPHQLKNEKLDARLTVLTLEIFHKNKRVASHVRKYTRGYSTIPEHMPKAHREYAEWTPERLVNWAAETGKFTAKLVDGILAGKVHPQQGFVSCMGVISLSKKYGKERVEAGSQRALAIGGISYTTLKSILVNGLDSKPLPEQTVTKPGVIHSNLRGKNYYQLIAETSSVTQ